MIMKTKKQNTLEKPQISNYPEEINILDKEYWLNKVRIGYPFDYYYKKRLTRPNIFEYAPEQIKKDKEIATEAILHREYFGNIDPIFQNDKQFILDFLALNKGYHPFISFPEKMQLDEDIFHICFENDVSCYRWLPYEKRKERDFSLSLVKKNALVYEYLPDIYQKDIEFGQAAIEQNLESLKFIPKSITTKLLNTKDIVEPILKEKSSYFEYIHSKLRKDKAFVTPYLQKNSYLFRFINKNLLQDKEFLSQFTHDKYSISEILYLAHNTVKEDKEFMLSCIKTSYTSYYYLPYSLRNDVQLHRSIMKHNIETYLLFPESMKRDEYVLSELLSRTELCVERHTWDREKDKYQSTLDLMPQDILEPLLDEALQQGHDPYPYVRSIFLDRKLSQELNEGSVKRKLKI